MLVTFGLELRYIGRSRPAPELAATVTWVEGMYGSEPGSFDAPIGVAVHPSGDIYVADLGNKRIQRFNPEGTFRGLWPAADGPQLGQPSDVAVDRAGDVYVLDAFGAILRLNPDGSLTEVVALAPLQAFSPRGLIVDPVRDVFYVADTGRGRILVITKDGSLLDTWGGGGESALRLQEPRGLGLDSQGNLFVAEVGSSRVRKFSPDGALLAQWRVKGRLADLAVGSDDRVYVTAGDRARLWVYDAEGGLIGQVDRALQGRSLPPTQGLAVVGPGDVIVGAGTVIVRLSVQFEE